MAGSNRGTMFGPGIYLADSVTGLAIVLAVTATGLSHAVSTVSNCFHCAAAPMISRRSCFFFFSTEVTKSDDTWQHMKCSMPFHGLQFFPKFDSSMFNAF